MVFEGEKTAILRGAKKGEKQRKPVEFMLKAIVMTLGLEKFDLFGVLPSLEEYSCVAIAP